MKNKLTAFAVATLLASPGLYAQSNQEIATQLKQLQDQIQRLQAELATLKRQQNATPSDASVDPTQASEPTPIAHGAATTNDEVTKSGNASLDNPLSMFGYGELNFTRPKNDVASSVATAKRAVIGIGYRFNERTRFISEFEVENAVVSQDDTGEAEFEQLYIEHDLKDDLSAKMGLFLMPFGYINETHEPTRYYGVNRNLVETAIIPSTWREMGVGLRGNTDAGLRWDAGLVTSFDLTKWPTTGNASSETLASPLGSIHQEGQNAKAASAGYYGVVNYNGIPGFNVGGGIFQGGIGQRQTTPVVMPNASVTLTDMHARWQQGAWDVSALAAVGRFENVASFNANISAGNPVPDQFRGWYAQAAYRLWHQGDYSLSSFTRYERLNTAVGFSGVPQGTVINNDLPDLRVWTLGANFYLHPQVVLKADFQRYLNDSRKDRYDFGIGFHY